MKLSMWMIANRLSSLDIEVNIRESSPAVLLSARRAYATNCVYVYESGDDCFCAYGKDSIRIRDTKLAEGFEIVQDVFDFYNNWEDQLHEAIAEGDYHGIINTAWLVFNNPMVLFNGNSQVLALTEKYPLGSVDSEWDYLLTYGNSSINAIMEMMRSSDRHMTLEGGVNRFSYYTGEELPLASMAYSIFNKGLLCGQVVVLAKERQLNHGDYQLLKFLADALQNLMSSDSAENGGGNKKVFYYLLHHMDYDEKQLDLQLQYRSWVKQGRYFVTVVSLKNRDQITYADYLLNVVYNLLQSRYPKCEIMKQDDSVVIISAYDIRQGSGSGVISEIAASNPVRIVFTGFCRGIEDIGYLYELAEYVLDYSAKTAPEEKLLDFYDYAVDYLLEAPSLKHSVIASIPAVRKMWQRRQENGDELLRTLEVFLNNECSVSKTASELFTHRNTVLYRLNKIRSMLDRDLEDSYLRNYCRMSIRVMELASLRGLE